MDIRQPVAWAQIHVHDRQSLGWSYDHADRQLVKFSFDFRTIRLSVIFFLEIFCSFHIDLYT